MKSLASSDDHSRQLDILKARNLLVLKAEDTELVSEFTDAIFWAGIILTIFLIAAFVMLRIWSSNQLFSERIKMVRAENINNNSVVTEVLKRLTVLPISLQEQVLEFVVKLKNSDFNGISGSKLIRYAGMISSEDLNIMSQVIQNDCGRIDLNEW